MKWDNDFKMTCKVPDTLLNKYEVIITIIIIV